MLRDKSHACVDCGLIAPETETAHTLIGPKFRWRVSRRPDANGTFVAEWRCPSCWRAFKSGKGLTASGEHPAFGPVSSDGPRGPA